MTASHSRRLLVVGADRVDAGKTTFAVGALARLQRRDRSPVGVKPRAGNDWWFDHEDCRTALADGRLYGKDARRLVEAADTAPVVDGSGPTIERLNPVHRLWLPTPGRTGLLGERGRQFLVDRVSSHDNGGATDRFVVNGTADLPEQVRQRLPLAEAPRVDSVAAFNDLMTDQHLPALDRLAERVQEAPTVVVESYADIAWPLRGVGYDAVAVVAPTRVRVYDGDRWALACDTARGSRQDGRLEERAGRVAGMIDPLATLDIPPLTSAERSDPAAVADAYAPALDAVLDVAARPPGSNDHA